MAVAVAVVMCAGAVAEASTPVVSIRAGRSLPGVGGDDRDGMVSLLSCISEAARRLCVDAQHHAAVIETAGRGPVSPPVLHLIQPIPTQRPHALPTIQPHLLNLPPPLAAL